MLSSVLSKLTSVSQYRLAVHLTIACLIFAACVWIMRGLSAHSRNRAPAGFGKAGAVVVAVLCLVQIYLGALVAGLDAGMSYNTRSEEHTSELQSLMRTSYAVFCLKKKIIHTARQRPRTQYTQPTV